MILIGGFRYHGLIFHDTVVVHNPIGPRSGDWFPMRRKAWTCEEGQLFCMDAFLWVLNMFDLLPETHKGGAGRWMPIKEQCDDVFWTIESTSILF